MICKDTICFHYAMLSPACGLQSPGYPKLMLSRALLEQEQWLSSENHGRRMPDRPICRRCWGIEGKEELIQQNPRAAKKTILNINVLTNFLQ